MRPLDAVLSSSLARPRFYSMVLSGFADSALLVPVGGREEALLFDTRRRGHELRIRMALGASLIPARVMAGPDPARVLRQPATPSR